MTSTPSIERVSLGELTCWQIRHQGAELLVAEQGAQVLRYIPAGQRPLIWLSEQAILERGRSVRGGVPVCWPWFGDLSRNPEAVRSMQAAADTAPAHGHVRARNWTLSETQSQGMAGLVFVYDTRTDPLPGWPHDAELKLEIHLDDALHLRLTTRNRGATELAFSQALHTYFAVSDVRKLALEGMANRAYIETLDDWSRRTQTDEPVIDRETDRIYLGLPAQLSVLDRDWNRRIELITEGSRSAVLWNPWIDKAKRLSDFSDDAWQRMLCIETANVLDDYVRLASDASHTLGVSLASKPLT
ncbi:D-hexose-6-phosphate mutarotase [Stutzerimonas urumqiensis]|uniref:D-hexose-6-phosphate mutarotase n=1 Tax=Stutzerimonas urumqiensis TaxID=638269 RepID=UPI003BA97723